MRVVIVGGGITGASAAWRLQRLHPEATVTLLEASDRLGGKLHTERIRTAEGEYLGEAGAESFITRKPELWQLAAELGLQSQLERTSDALGMAVWRDDGMLPVPLSPLAFLRSPILSARGKLRMLREPFIQSIPPGHGDETMATFVTRRLGREALDNLIGPIIGGIYNADPQTQSVRVALSLFSDLERDYGGIAKGMLRRPRPPRDPGQPRGAVRFSQGVDALFEALARQLCCEVRLNAPVRVIERAQNFVVHSDGASYPADAILLATPATVSARLLAVIAPDAAAQLAQFSYQPIGTALLAYRAADVPVPAAIKGLIIPRRERRKIDAVLFASHKQPSCAPTGYNLMRVFFGGAAPEMVTLGDTALLDVIRVELAALLNIQAPPLHIRINRWPDGFVRAPVGHLDIVAAIRQALPARVEIAGAAYDGVGVSDCIRQAWAGADRLCA